MSSGLSDTFVVRAAIHPAMGIARVGNSESGYFFGPEVVNPKPASVGSYKDETGALKRQAVKFRVFGYNAAGEAVAELTSDIAEIRWNVHVANKKAAWYQFQIALDIPEASSADPSQLRNATVQDRSQLMIDPGARSIQGPSESGEQYRFDSGKFMGNTVYLGELSTDDRGRLVFLGGRGVSASHDGSIAQDFANNDGWHDDVSDGPVTAEVMIGGRQIPTDAAWIIVAPPNYGPNLRSVRSMYDLLLDTYVQAGWLPFPEKISFTRHIYPIFARMVDLQWVNNGFAVQFGWGGTNHFEDAGYLRKLASNADGHREWRREIFNMFRDPGRDGLSPVPWPWIYGDAMNLPPVSARQHLALSATQRRMLEFWADGQFEADYDAAAGFPQALDEVPLADQPTMLDEANLSFCLADAFHPGCEMTWPARHTSLYQAPFRIRLRTPNDAQPNYGSQLMPEVCMSVNGPLYAQGPGDMTRWMAVPWQTDTASCRSGYYAGYGAKYDSYVPTFWPARVPNHVFTLEDYSKVINLTLPREQRLELFRQRADWFRTLGSNVYPQPINTMVRDFGKMGVIEVRDGIPDDPGFPPVMQVESQVSVPSAARTEGDQTVVIPNNAAQNNKVRRFPRGLRET
jgi:hypothetical protein